MSREPEPTAVASDRPPVGSRWWMACGSRLQPVEVLGPEDDRFDMIACKTTRRYTTRDQFDWPVRHPVGERTLIPAENLTAPANDLAVAFRGRQP